MARDLSCPSGKKAYKTKRDALAAGAVPANFGRTFTVKRCDRCRFWHVAESRRRGGGTRK